MAAGQSRFNTSKWTAGRQQFRYTPQMWLCKRLCDTAALDSLKIRKDGTPSDEALLARWWFAYSKPVPKCDGKLEFVSFEECCHWLGRDAETTEFERLAYLERIDAHADFDTEECDARLEVILAEGIDVEEERFPLPEMFRVVRAVDQLSLLDLVIASMGGTAAA